MLSYLRRYWQIALAAYVSLTLSSAANLATPRLLQILIDQGITAKDMSHIISLAAIMVGIALVGAISSSYKATCLRKRLKAWPSIYETNSSRRYSAIPSVTTINLEPDHPLQERKGEDLTQPSSTRQHQRPQG